jgi:hypothetical protein
MSFNITHLDDFDWREVKIDWDAMAGDVIKAGTPMSREGLIANDGNAYGILMDDVQRKRNKRGRVIVAGCVDVAKAEEHSGVKLSAAAKKALGDVWSQGFGGALPEGVPYAQTTEVALVKDVTTRVNNTTYIVDGAGAAIKIELGKKYRVMWDGVEYICPAVDDSTPDKKIKHFISDNGEYYSDAFTICYDQTCFSGNWMEPSCGIRPHDDSVPHTVSLYEIVEDVQKLDPRCLPELTSPNGTKYQLTVSDDGTLSAVAVS